MKAELIRHDKVTDELGNTIEIKIWHVPPSKDKPHGIKYSLAYIANNRRVIGYDNSERKGDHKHYGDNEIQYSFISVWKLIRDFYEDTEKFKRGEL